MSRRAELRRAQRAAAAREGGAAASEPIPSGTGNCFEVAGQALIDAARSGVELTLVHALIVGQGPIEGVIHWHAWIERGAVAYDWSNGKQIAMPVDVYRALARVQQSWEYDAREAVHQMRLTQHYGPWLGPVDHP